MATKELKELLTMSFCCGELVSELSDSFQVHDLDEVLKAAKAVGPGLKDAGKALDEYAAMTDEEALELEEWANEEFDIANDEVEKAIETGLKVVIQLRELAALIVKKPAAVPVPHKET